MSTHKEPWEDWLTGTEQWDINNLMRLVEALCDQRRLHYEQKVREGTYLRKNDVKEDAQMAVLYKMISWSAHDHVLHCDMTAEEDKQLKEWLGNSGTLSRSDVPKFIFDVVKKCWELQDNDAISMKGSRFSNRKHLEGVANYAGRTKIILDMCTELLSINSDIPMENGKVVEL
ncbi:hypothetical protein OAE26_02070 [Synechococcus sp. AH-551-E05]|nr:hypothetical protein [Synechococcus sp. AH-551-E05]MDB4651341.1 hypothetical protein [Synechococcus sp. AH-551-E05]